MAWTEEPEENEGPLALGREELGEDQEMQVTSQLSRASQWMEENSLSTKPCRAMATGGGRCYYDSHVHVHSMLHAFHLQLHIRRRHEGWQLSFLAQGTEGIYPALPPCLLTPVLI